jgi:hypothetical protein
MFQTRFIVISDLYLFPFQRDRYMCSQIYSYSNTKYYAWNTVLTYDLILVSVGGLVQNYTKIATFIMDRTE